MPPLRIPRMVASKSKGFLKGIKSNVEDELARRMMIQWEINMAVSRQHC
jgi:hypothetical protein